MQSHVSLICLKFRWSCNFNKKHTMLTWNSVTPTLKYEKSIATIPVWDFVWELIFAIYWLVKNKKNKYFPQPLLRYRNFKIWRPLKQTKWKNGWHLFMSTFENLQLCFFVQNDSFTLKVLKMQFVLGWAYNKEHCRMNMQCPLS